MKISNKLISLPPHISTTWGNVTSLHYDDGQLLITLKDGKLVSIPSLDSDTVQRIFDAHAAYLENSSQEASPSPSSPKPKGKGLELPFQLMGKEGMGEMGSMLQHDPQQSGGPDLPASMLDKISAVAEVLSPDDPAMVPSPEVGCNCFHCQITRAIRRGMHLEEDEVFEAESEGSLEEEVSEDDLRFREWDIEQKAEGIYCVTNPIDQSEHYLVHLKEPIGCTCGRERCEHIEAVLKS